MDDCQGGVQITSLLFFVTNPQKFRINIRTKNTTAMTSKHFTQMIDLSQEDLSTMIPTDGIYEDIECSCCEGEGCEVCNFTGLEYPDEY